MVGSRSFMMIEPYYWGLGITEYTFLTGGSTIIISVISDIEAACEEIIRAWNNI
jgi:hypothetical protein